MTCPCHINKNLNTSYYRSRALIPTTPLQFCLQMFVRIMVLENNKWLKYVGAFEKHTLEQSRGSNQAEQTGDQKFTDETYRRHCMKDNIDQNWQDCQDQQDKIESDSEGHETLCIWRKKCEIRYSVTTDCQCHTTTMWSKKTKSNRTKRTQVLTMGCILPRVHVLTNKQPLRWIRVLKDWYYARY